MFDPKRGLQHVLLTASMLIFAGCQADPGGFGGGLSSLWNGSRKQSAVSEQKPEVDAASATAKSGGSQAPVSERGGATNSGNSLTKMQQRGNSASTPSFMRGAASGPAFGGGVGAGGFGSIGGAGGLGWGPGGSFGGGGSAGGVFGPAGPGSGEVTLSDTLSRQIGDPTSSSGVGTLLSNGGSDDAAGVLPGLANYSDSTAGFEGLPGLGNSGAMTGSDLIVPIGKPETAPIINLPTPSKPALPAGLANPEPPSLVLLAAGAIVLCMYHFVSRRKAPAALPQKRPAPLQNQGQVRRAELGINSNGRPAP